MNKVINVAIAVDVEVEVEVKAEVEVEVDEMSVLEGVFSGPTLVSEGVGVIHHLRRGGKR